MKWYTIFNSVTHEYIGEILGTSTMDAEEAMIRQFPHLAYDGVYAIDEE